MEASSPATVLMRLTETEPSPSSLASITCMREELRMRRCFAQHVPIRFAPYTLSLYFSVWLFFDDITHELRHVLEKPEFHQMTLIRYQHNAPSRDHPPKSCSCASHSCFRCPRIH